MSVAPNFFTGMVRWTPRWNPLVPVVPFTYRDGYTVMQLIEDTREYIEETFAPDVNALVQSAFDQLTSQVDEFTQLTQENYNTFQTAMTTLVDSINNRVGPTEVQHVILTADTELVIDATWPDNHMLFFEVTQDSVGGHSLAFPANVTGTLDLNRASGGVTTFSLTPDGNGNWRVDDTYLRTDQADVLLSPLQAALGDMEVDLNVVQDDLTTFKDRAASVEELSVDDSFWYQGTAGALQFDYSANFTGFVAPFPLRILSIDMVFEQCDIPSHATNYLAVLVRRATGGGSGGYNTFVSKSTQASSGEAIVARKTWSLAGGTWTPQYQVFAKGDAVNFALSFAGSVTVTMPFKATIRYMPL